MCSNEETSRCLCKDLVETVYVLTVYGQCAHEDVNVACLRLDTASSVPGRMSNFYPDIIVIRSWQHTWERDCHTLWWGRGYSKDIQPLFYLNSLFQILGFLLHRECIYNSHRACPGMNSQLIKYLLQDSPDLSSVEACWSPLTRSPGMRPKSFKVNRLNWRGEDEV